MPPKMPVVLNSAGDPVGASPTFDVITRPASKWVKLTKANTDLADGVCRALLVGTAGTANLQDAEGTNTTDVPLFEGINPLMCKQVRTGGTADDIWALY